MVDSYMVEEVRKQNAAGKIGARKGLILINENCGRKLYAPNARDMKDSDQCCVVLTGGWVGKFNGAVAISSGYIRAKLGCYSD